MSYVVTVNEVWSDEQTPRTSRRWGQKFEFPLFFPRMGVPL